MDDRTVGILGGGQLGRMMVEAANRLGVRVAILDPQGSNSPAGQLSNLSIEGSFQDKNNNKIKELAAISDVVTTEIEHIDTIALEELENKGHVVHPNFSTIRLIQDKYLQKNHLAEHGIPLPDYMETSTIAAAKEAGLKFGYPFMLKNKKLAYDGRGNALVKSIDTLEQAYTQLGGSLDGDSDLYAEKWVPFVKELAVMVVRTIEGRVITYPVVETIQHNNICHIVIAPAQVPPPATQAALEVAHKAIASLSGAGIFGVELFLLNDETCILNEIAPRAHNSGHYTIEACEVDQFEMLIRTVLGMPIPTFPTTGGQERIPMKVGASMMINILGGDSMADTKDMLQKALGIPGAAVHWYGKAENRAGRKMAHITVTAENFTVLRQRVESLGLTEATHQLAPVGPKVAIIMGSDSDLPTMKDAAEVLEQFGVSYEISIVSAHRTPSRMYSYSQTAAERGIQVIIAGAGGAAHLPGMVAALTPLPVIGVPIKTSILNGNDSLLSIVMMPKGIPVATVAIGNAANAGLLAVRILGAADPIMLQKMDDFMVDQEDTVLKKSAKLEAVGYASYLKDMK
jgi:phosphoribosylaminoimidazole carboxylase